MTFCKFCRKSVPGCVHATPGPEPVMGWLALAFFLGLGIVFYLGSCA